MEDENQLIERASSLISESGPMSSATVGRAITTILNVKPKKLQSSISRLQFPPKVALPPASLEQSLWFLHKYIGEAVEKGERLDQVLVPIVQKSLTRRQLKQENQALILLNWLFQDEILFQDIIQNLATIIFRRHDHTVALGWCILGRAIIEYEDIGNSVATNAIREKHEVILKTFCSCRSQILSLICNGSTMLEGFELPTRLAIAAADFILSLTIALTAKDFQSNCTNKKQTSSSVNSKNRPVNSLPTATNGRDDNTLSKLVERTSLESKLLLWNSLNELITLVEKLASWNRKSRSLHAKGLEHVCKWLHEVKQLYGHFQDESESQMMKTGYFLLSSCWKHYGMLSLLEDRRLIQQYKDLLNQYLSGIQFYAEDDLGETGMSKGNKSDTVNFFLNCLMLLIGRLDDKQFEDAIAEFGSQISQVLLSQLRCADEQVIDGAIGLFKAVILKTNHTSSKISLDDIHHMDASLKMLLNLLEEQDAAAKAVVKLVAEYCSVCSNNECLHEVLKCFGSTNTAKRRNAVDIVSDVIHLSSESHNTLSRSAWQDVAKHLLECLEDEDLIIQNQAANLIPIIDPALVLPALVHQSYSSNERVNKSASRALVALLVNHKQEPEPLCMMLDSLSKLSQTPDSGTPNRKEGSTFDVDKLLKLLPEWAKNVEDWHVMVGPLIEKMLAEPSNAVIVRFFSHISEYLAGAVDLVFHQLLLYRREQKERMDSNSEHLLFSRLAPFLVIRLLPLKVFDDLNSTCIYGEYLRSYKGNVSEARNFSSEDTECIAAMMISSALNNSEFEDVRKLAAELCGRIHPQVLVPVLSSLLESAVNVKDLFKIKVCLFSFCTSLMVRGNDTYSHLDISRIRIIVQKILSWTSGGNVEVSKAQHGCIDCLAWMVCTELEARESSKGTEVPGGSVLSYVICQLIGEDYISSQPNGGDGKTEETAVHLSIRLCMANVLISAFQKISSKRKKSLVKKIIPRVVPSIGLLVEPEVRASCIQVLFTAVYHLKSAIYPYSNELLGVALKSLQEGSYKEKLAGAKLLTCLMGSEEEVVESISSGLLEARRLLERLASTEPSEDVRQICQQLHAALTMQ